VRLVRAPVGVVEYEPAEMTVRVGAGTTVAALDGELAEAGQTVALPDWPGATVGGVLAVGHSGIRRLGWGPVRDTLLEARFVSADGRLVKAGGPTVKNVSGFDLCRVLVGSLGRLGLLGEVVLRTRPLPRRSAWLAGPADPWAVRDRLHRPSAVLWDGTTTWALLEGHEPDVAAQGLRLGDLGLVPVEHGPELPPHRSSASSDEIRALRGSFVAEIGVGVVHRPEQPQVATPSDVVVRLNRRLEAEFDPTGRLNPGRDPLAVA
jgi:glycolate oxidase FAD binding subunit